MSRVLRVLVPVSILIVTVALMAVVISQGEVLGAAPVLGVFFVVFGAVSVTLHLTLSDDFLRRHFGDQMRRAWRGGWAGILLGSALLGLHYLDHWFQANQAEFLFKTACNRGALASNAADWQAAAKAYSEAILVAPQIHADTADVHTRRGNARLHLADYSQAIDDFSEAIRLDPRNAAAYRGRGVAYFQQEEQNLTLALADFSEAIRLDPNIPSVSYNRGLAYVQTKDYDRALIDFGEAIRLNPSYTQAYVARSRVHAKKGDDPRARADQRKAAELARSLERSKTPK